MAIYPTKALRSPEGTTRILAQAIDAGKLDVAASCFAHDACFVTPAAIPIRGREAIRPILAQLIAMEARVEIEVGSLLVADEVALGSEFWHIHFRGVNGAPFRQTFPASMVLRRLEESWTLEIAAPWGVGHRIPRIHVDPA